MTNPADATIDANEDFDGLQFEFTVETGNEDDDEAEQTETDMPRNSDGPAGAARTTRGTHDHDDGSLTADFHPVSSLQLVQMLGVTGLNQILARGGFLSRSRRNDNDDDEDLQEGYGGLGSRRRRKSRAVENQYPEVPNIEGQKMMASGTYGNHDHYLDARLQRKKNIATRIMYRELGLGTPGFQNSENMLMAQVPLQTLTVANQLNTGRT